MDLDRYIKELRDEQARIDDTIRSLEQIVVGRVKGRGRPPLTSEQRAERAAKKAAKRAGKAKL